MSHWLEGKINCRCTIDQMARAFKVLKPEWESFIKTDPTGKLTARNNYTGGKSAGWNLVIPGGGAGAAPGLRFADIAMKQNPKTMEWTFIAVEPQYLPPDLRDMEHTMAQAVSAQRTRDLAKQEGFQVIEEKEGDEVRVKLRVPVEEQWKLQALLSGLKK